ncbi:unnamed protein product [Mytilus coruscus]|uniref:Uncharacterized protein n=1 Tax=Mytilus coruscus TaxID=42192 RepID=A0A6J8BK70_MYTCO|nr:unnamed protein product [Mytilus coruscus]
MRITPLLYNKALNADRHEEDRCEDKYTNLTIAHEKQPRMLYRVIYELESTEALHSCGKTVDIECDIGRQKFNISEKHDLDCKTLDESKSTIIPYLAITESVTAVVVVVVMLILVCFINTRHKKSRRNAEGHDEGLSLVEIEYVGNSEMCQAVTRLPPVSRVTIRATHICAAGTISWTQLTKPAIFGNDVSLRCHLTSETSCCDSFARKWSAGKYFDLIMMNGVSSNASKYTETVDNRLNTSTLTIKNFNKNNVNIPYECTYGFDTFSKTLELTQANFEFYPAEQIPVDLAIDENRIAALNVTFKTIFPAPVCSASDDVTSVAVQVLIPLLLSSGALLSVALIVSYIVSCVKGKFTCLKTREHREEQRESSQMMVTSDDGNEMDILSQASDVLEDTTGTPQEL